MRAIANAGNLNEEAASAREHRTGSGGRMRQTCERRKSMEEERRERLQGEEAGTPNYYYWGAWSLFGRRVLYLYIDLPDCPGEASLKKQGVRVKSATYYSRKSEDTDYTLVKAVIRREDKQKFVDAMEDLKRKMLIFGRLDYEAFCGRVFREMDEDLKEIRRKKTGRRAEDETKEEREAEA